jgi:hypothetical protein
MTVSHTWHDQHIETINTAENANAAEEGEKRRLLKGTSTGAGETGDALLRVAALCNRAEFKPGQVKKINKLLFLDPLIIRPRTTVLPIFYSNLKLIYF